MERIKYDLKTMEYISLFESLTGAKLKDCLLNNNNLIFIVEENQMGKAIGKKGINIKKIENLIKKKIRVIEFNGDVKEFIRNVIYPLRIEDIKEENNEIIIDGRDKKTRSLLIGRDRQNISNTKSIIDRFFKIEEIKVV